MGKRHETPCPCGKGFYARCCGPLHAGATATDAESLMRSRYSAYALRIEDYLLATWHADTRPRELSLAEDDCKWIGLEIRRHEPTGEGTAMVEFVARYRIGGRAHRMHETSHFRREAGRWYYVAGDVDRD